MKPQEKALELFSIYRFALSLPGAPLGEEKDNVAKQCALIAVDECINIHFNLESDRNGIGESFKYWQEVKQELEKL
jgi:hypothetical protein